jgi:hypothetical protein
MESTKSRVARRRYLKHFGPFNQVISVQNHTLVLLDAPGLVEEDNMRTQNIEQYEPVKDGPMDFVKSMEPGIVFHGALRCILINRLLFHLVCRYKCSTHYSFHTYSLGSSRYRFLRSLERERYNPQGRRYRLPKYDRQESVCVYIRAHKSFCSVQVGVCLCLDQHVSQSKLVVTTGTIASIRIMLYP